MGSTLSFAPFAMNSPQPSLQKFEVKGMSCQHCVRAVTQAIQAQDAQAQVSIALEQGSVQVQSALPRERLAAAIRDEGYEVMG
ncbi:MAG: hypothetical protein RLZ51_2281 [Pseudomonadota bacterium]